MQKTEHGDDDDNDNNNDDDVDDDDDDDNNNNNTGIAAYVRTKQYHLIDLNTTVSINSSTL